MSHARARARGLPSARRTLIEAGQPFTYIVTLYICHVFKTKRKKGIKRRESKMKKSGLLSEICRKE